MTETKFAVGDRVIYKGCDKPEAQDVEAWKLACFLLDQGATYHISSMARFPGGLFVRLAEWDDHDFKAEWFRNATAVKEAVQVKPLVWINRPNDPQGYTWKARKPFGSAYYLHEKDGLHSWGGDYVPLEEAKAAAQSDYEARILSALKGGEA